MQLQKTKAFKVYTQLRQSPRNSIEFMAALVLIFMVAAVACAGAVFSRWGDMLEGQAAHERMIDNSRPEAAPVNPEPSRATAAGNASSL